MTLSDIALKRSVTHSERVFRFAALTCSMLLSGLVAAICCHDPDSSSILIKISTTQKLFCEYPLKRTVSCSERFFPFHMILAESDSGLLSGRFQKDQTTDRVIRTLQILKKEIPLAATEQPSVAS